MDNIIEIVGFGITIFGLFFGIYQYKKSNDLQKAQWIDSFYSRFYLEGGFEYIKNNLFFNFSENIQNALNASINKKENKTEQELSDIGEIVNLFNFFEYIFYLNEKGQIENKDIKVMFGGFLKKISNQELVLNFLKINGYEKTLKYINITSKNNLYK